MSLQPASRPVILTALLAALLATAGCTGLQTPRAMERARPLVVQVEVIEDPATDSWQASYRLPGPAAGVELVRLRDGAPRAEGWNVAAGTETHWYLGEGVERLCFDRPTARFAVAFRSDFRARAGEHPVQVAFSDGSRLLHTGHLQVRPLASCGGSEDDSAASSGATTHRWRFVTAAQRTVRVRDQAGSGSLAWAAPEGSRDETTLVYFGDLSPRDGPRLSLLLDPALPAAVRAETEALLPRLFDLFAAETGLALPTRSLALVSASGDTGDGRAFAGGALDGVLALTVANGGVSPNPDAARRAWFHFLARETFALWAGHLLVPDHESEWLATAAAETFALTAARRFELTSDHELTELLVARANSCLAELAGAPLLRPSGGSSPAAHADCGTVILFVAGAAVVRQGDGTPSPDSGTPAAAGGAPVASFSQGLGELFRHALAEGITLGGSLRTGLLLGWLDRLTTDRQTVFALQRLIRTGVPTGFDLFLHRLLRGAGLPVALVPLEEAGAAAALYQTLLAQALTRCACGEPLLQEEPLDATGGSRDACQLLAGGASVERLDDLDSREDPARSWARLRSAVLLQRPLRVGLSGRPSLLLLCPAATLDSSFESLLRLE